MRASLRRLLRLRVDCEKQESVKMEDGVGATVCEGPFKGEGCLARRTIWLPFTRPGAMFC